MAAACIVLVVEDEPLIRMDLVDRLSRLGCAVLEAGSAAEAIAILEQHREVTVVFTDVQMPGTMGWHRAGSICEEALAADRHRCELRKDPTGSR
jgi:CheY-like chemotaxis protein